MACTQEQPALQVIVLGAGGGPKEDNVTAFLVRSTAAGWKKGCLLAVDAGVHLASITRIIETHNRSSVTSDGTGREEKFLVDGPFKGLPIPYESPKAIAAYITRSLVDTYLITHPHLDHISGFVVNTAALPGVRPKRLAGLPYTIEAFKNHIFNNIIWPNLSDENGGAGLVTYMRLTEGGSPALGDGETKGYVEVSEGLGIKGFSVSHGKCMDTHPQLSSNSLQPVRNSSPRGSFQSANRPRPGRSNSSASFQSNHSEKDEFGPQDCVYNSSTYFIRDITTGKEIVIFGDVEADSLSLSPRNKRIWSEAAPKIVTGSLRGIFIECSYDDSRDIDSLFGHLAPRFLIQELKVLAEEVRSFKNNLRTSLRKRKLDASSNGSGSPRRKQPTRNSNQNRKPSFRLDDMGEQFVENEQASFTIASRQEPPPLRPHITRSASSSEEDLPLKGLRVVAIHIKDKLNDGPEVWETILLELKEYEKVEKLGCEFVIAKSGEAYYF